MRRAEMAHGRTTFMVLSDTHNLEQIADLRACPQALPKVDVLLHCGDLTQVGGLSAYKKALRLLGSIEAELKLVIAGNHDISLDGEYWRAHLEEDDEPEEHDRAVEIMTGPLAEAAGVTYLTEGTHTFTLQSGRKFTIYASPYQPECGDWAFGYQRTQDRFSLEPAAGMNSIAERPMPDGVDIVMTHGPPRGILDVIPSKEEHAGCDAVLHAVQRVRPLMHCFGHIHEGHGLEMKAWDVEDRAGPAQTVTVRQASTDQEARCLSVVRGASTLMVNAAIMDDHNSPAHAPWIVELEI